MRAEARKLRKGPWVRDRRPGHSHAAQFSGDDDDGSSGAVGDPVADSTEDTIGEDAVTSGPDHQQVGVLVIDAREQARCGRVVLDHQGAMLDAASGERFDPMGAQVLLKLESPGAHRVGRDVAEELMAEGEHVYREYGGAGRGGELGGPLHSLSCTIGAVDPDDKQSQKPSVVVTHRRRQFVDLHMVFVPIMLRSFF